MLSCFHPSKCKQTKASMAVKKKKKTSPTRCLECFCSSLLLLYCASLLARFLVVVAACLCSLLSVNFILPCHLFFCLLLFLLSFFFFFFFVFFFFYFFFLSFLLLSFFLFFPLVFSLSTFILSDIYSSLSSFFPYLFPFFYSSLSSFFCLLLFFLLFIISCHFFCLLLFFPFFLLAPPPPPFLFVSCDAEGDTLLTFAVIAVLVASSTCTLYTIMSHSWPMVHFDFTFLTM